MSAVRALLNDLQVIGATVVPSGERLVLRAGPKPIPGSLVRRVRECKSEILEALAPSGAAVAPVSEAAYGSDLQTWIVDWLNQHPTPSRAGLCGWCGKLETVAAVVLPFGTEAGGHTWLHAECWPEWHQARREEAVRALNASADGIL